MTTSDIDTRLTGMQEVTRGKRLKDLTGQRFGKLLIVGTAGRNDAGKILWRGVCDCGGEIVGPRVNIGYGKTTSCGCAKSRPLDIHGYPTGFVALYRTYFEGAASRGLEFNLSPEVFYDLVRSNCTYCGAQPAKKFNGVDRVNNDLGYTPENSVSCCKVCNMAKRDMGLDQFLGWARRIALHQRLLDSEVCDQL